MAIEIYQNAPIFYSLGNFTFDWDSMRGRNLNGLLVRCLVAEGKISEIGFVPVRRDDRNDIVVLDPTTPAGRDVCARIGELSEGLNVDFTSDAGEVRLTPRH